MPELYIPVDSLTVGRRVTGRSMDNDLWFAGSLDEAVDPDEVGAYDLNAAGRTSLDLIRKDEIVELKAVSRALAHYSMVALAKELAEASSPEDNAFIDGMPVEDVDVVEYEDGLTVVGLRMADPAGKLQAKRSELTQKIQSIAEQDPQFEGFEWDEFVPLVPLVTFDEGDLRDTTIDRMEGMVDAVKPATLNLFELKSRLVAVDTVVDL